ncbi:hypothetical protein SNE40_023545 [Patella caerulea]|uniref:Innexin n=1 Tax=Patella caerulea TaxID=87958 RepID=A0AAN8G3E3_PATCE
MADLNHRPYYDFGEGVNFTRTSLILLICVAIAAVTRYAFLTSVITCWTPAEFTENHVTYTHHTCWSQDIFIVVNTSAIILPESEKTTRAFHKFIPTLLTFIMLGFQIPRAFNIITNIFLDTEIERLRGDMCTDPRQYEVQELADAIKEDVDRNRVIRFMIQFFVKILVGLNIIIQMFFVKCYFLDSLRKSEVTPVFIFPKTIRCQFPLRQMQNVRDYTLQCSMPINYLYEQFIYIFWFWILGVGIVTGLVFIDQLASLVIPLLVRHRSCGISQRGF